MFTGIIEEMGIVENIARNTTSARLGIKAKKIFEDMHLGDSIAVNGVCLTVTKFEGTVFYADVMKETLDRSSLGELVKGSKVNLERAMPLNGRFGGHIVSGHIDDTGVITKIQKESIATIYTIKTSSKVMNYIIEKGSITIDGISLTVVGLERDSFRVSIIPHTQGNTTLSDKKIGSKVNLENDIVGKYVEKFLQTNQGITREFLTDNGF